MLQQASSGDFEVLNMPLVAQGDPGNDPDFVAEFDDPKKLSDQLGAACYDACIAVVAATSTSTVSNRQPEGRTKEFVSLTAKVHPSGTHTDRAVRQLSYQYRTARQGKPFYFQEVLADYGPILQDHDPRDYNGAVNRNPVATSAIGATFYDGPRHGHLDSDYIRQLLKLDYAVLIAYGGFVPTVTDDPSSPGKVVVRLDKASGDQHKVVVSGLGSGPRPLRVNNIVNSGQSWAALRVLDTATIRSVLELTKDVSRIEFSFGGTLNAGWDSMAYLDIDWSNYDPTKKLFVLEQVDALTLAYDFGTEVWRGRWGSGWSTLAPFTWNGQPHLIAYNKDSGEVHFDRLHTGGAAGVWSHTWGTGWSHIVPFIHRRSGLVGPPAPRFFAYDTTTGLAHFNEFEPSLQGPIIKHELRWGAGWTHFMPFSFNGTDHMIAYRSDTGLVHIDHLVPNGAETRWEGAWGRWSHFAPFRYAGKAHFVADDSATGLTHIDQFDPALTGSLGNWSGRIPGTSATVASCVATADYRGPGHLISAHPAGSQSMIQLSRLHNPPGGPVPVSAYILDFAPTHIVPFRIDGRSYALFYNATSGDVAIHTVGVF